MESVLAVLVGILVAAAIFLILGSAASPIATPPVRTCSRTLLSTTESYSIATERQETTVSLPESPSGPNPCVPSL